MTHTLIKDEDGDYIPCSVQRTMYAAKCWDLWKQIKYNGKSNAQSVVIRYWFKDSLRIQTPLNQEFARNCEQAWQTKKVQ